MVLPQPATCMCYRKNSVLLENTVKNYRSASPLACRQSLLVLSSNGRAKARVTRARVASTWVVRGGLARGPLCGKRDKKVSPLFCGLI